jgi:hypothetical protein
MRTCVRISEAGTVRAKFARALAGNAYRTALMLAYELQQLTLDDAAQLTILAGAKDPQRFPAMARRLFARIIEEVKPPLSAVAIVGQPLADVEAGDLASEKLLGAACSGDCGGASGRVLAYQFQVAVCSTRFKWGSREPMRSP